MVRRSLLLFLFLITLSPGTAQSQPDGTDSLKSQPSQSSSVSFISVDGSINPTTFNYIERAHTTANERNDNALIIQLNTPGGLLTTTQDIVTLMLGSDLPIIVYVAPDGSNAGSAGTFITMAAHIAAMAPATNIGAASPVSMGGGQMDTVMQKKIFEFSESYIETIAEKRGRNTEWAKSAVRDGASITANEALEKNVIDFIAESLDELLEKSSEKEIDGETLNISNAEINRIELNLAEIFFGFIIRPEVMLILTLVSIYGILGEVTNPGAIVPGMAGVIALILLLFGVNALPINVAGFLLIGLAIILFVIEAFTPTFGILLTGGGVSFFLGALMLFQDLPENMQLSLYWIIPATILTMLFFAWIVTYGIKAQLAPPRSGIESMTGRIVEVVEDIDERHGLIKMDGEFWNARSETPIPVGDLCEIKRFEGLTIHVQPKQPKKG